MAICRSTPIDSFRTQGEQFLASVLSEAERREIQIAAHWQIDHLCYRVSELARYHEMKTFLASCGELLTESDVNGRPISTFRMHEPFIASGRHVELLELPAPKPSKPTPEGFEHIEVVCDVPFIELKSRFASLRTDDGGLKKSFNQEFEVELDSHAIKFHHLSLESVVCLESNEPVFKSIRSSLVLEKLKPFRPLIAGTFPLGLNVDGSDVDILVETVEPSEFFNFANNEFRAHDGFSIRKTEKEGLPTTIVNFRISGIPFEIFAQDRPSVEQTAYRHYLAEERALKFGGEHLRSKILTLREAGLKTEPAFARALALSGDPYEAILRIHGMPESDLLKLVTRALEI